MVICISTLRKFCFPFLRKYPKKPVCTLVLAECYVAGVQYATNRKVVCALPNTCSLRVKPEPENQFDPNALALYYGTIKLGYIPSKYNKIPQYLMLSGKRLSVTLIERQTNVPLWEALKIRIEVHIEVHI